MNEDTNNLNNLYDFEETVSWTKETIQEKLPEEILFPEELNRHLRNRLRDVLAENGSLRRSFEEVETKLQNAVENSVKLTASKSLGKPNEVAAAKIVELSKKCREQTAEVEVLKSKCKSLENNLAKKTTELENERQEFHRLNKSASTESRNSTDDNQSLTKEEEDRIKYLTEKLQQTQAKLYESKNTCATLKQDLSKAQKLLCSEVGENVTIAGLLNHPGGWRGRTEQIQLLQQKVTELQSKLSEYDGTQKSSSVCVERKSLAILRNSEKERRQQIENSAKELRQAEVALETYKRKLDAAKARIKVLENESTTIKANIAILNEKRSHDDHLIETLENRLKIAEQRYQERETDIKNKEEKIERDCTVLRNDLQAAQIQIDRLTKKLEEREIEIDNLRSGIIPEEYLKRQRFFHLEDQSVMRCHTSPPSTMRSSNEPNEYVTLALAAEAERERLFELVAVLNRRLDKEKNQYDNLLESLRNERCKAAKLETKLRKMEMEKPGFAKIDSGYKKRSLSKSKGSKGNEDFNNAEQTRLKLELLEEECLALKARLNTVLQDKALDLTTYKSMLDQAKKIFQEAYRNKPPGTSECRSTYTI